AGGLLLFLVAMDLLTGKAEDPSYSAKVNVALVPLGTPLLAGPGAIVAAMLAVQSSGGTVPGWVAIMLALIAVNICLYLGMRFAVIVHRVLGEGGTMLITRISGLLLAAIAVQLIADAVRAFVTGGRADGACGAAGCHRLPSPATGHRTGALPSRSPARPGRTSRRTIHRTSRRLSHRALSRGSSHARIRSGCHRGRRGANRRGNGH